MRTLATLATLFLGLAFVFWAPAAKAHCPHGNSTTHEHCIVPPPPPGATIGDLSCIEGDVAKFDGTDWYCESGPLVVRDGDGILVGPMFDFSGQEVRADGSVTVAMQMEVAGVPRIFLIQVGESGFKAGGGVMFSEDDSCGDPLYKALTGALSNLEKASFHDGFAYISETGSGPVFINRESFLDNEGVCSGPSSSPGSGPYFLMVEVDLTAFVPLFSAGF